MNLQNDTAREKLDIYPMPLILLKIISNVKNKSSVMHFQTVTMAGSGIIIVQQEWKTCSRTAYLYKLLMWLKIQNQQHDIPPRGIKYNAVLNSICEENTVPVTEAALGSWSMEPRALDWPLISQLQTDGKGDADNSRYWRPFSLGSTMAHLKNTILLTNNYITLQCNF